MNNRPVAMALGVAAAAAVAYAAGQTAMNVWTRWPPETKAAVWTAIFTFGLLAVAVIAAYIGLGTLRSANDMFALEAAPFLVVRQVTPNAASMPKLYVITAPDKGKGLVATLRPWDHSKDYPRGYGTGASKVNLHWSGAPNWSGTWLEINNVGRSPAVDIRLDATFKLIASDVIKYDAEKAAPDTDVTPTADSWAAGRDYPFELKQSGGFGFIRISSIMPREKTYVEIQNRYAANVELKIAQSGKARTVGAGDLEIPVNVQPAVIEIEFHSARTR